MANQINGTAVENNNRIAPFIDVEEHEAFDAHISSLLIKSVEFCQKVNTVYKNAIADFEGCKFSTNRDMMGYPVPLMEMYFNHREYPGTGLPIACSKDGNKIARSNVIEGIRRYDNRRINGDIYHLTEDGKNAISQIIYSGPGSNPLYNKNGEINWNSKKLVVDVADSQLPIPSQMTMVNFIDPTKLAAIIFGDRDENGDMYEYGISIVRSVAGINFSGGVGVSEYLLKIDRINSQRVEKVAATCGIAFGNGLNIVRAY